MDDMDPHVDFLKHPQKWPRWPMCPVKRRRPLETEVGVVWAGESAVILTNVYSFDPNAQQIGYKTIEEMVADGWRVD